MSTTENKAEAFDAMMEAFEQVLGSVEYAESPAELVYRLADERDEAKGEG